jgi:arsenite oxidase small subunit
MQRREFIKVCAASAAAAAASELSAADAAPVLYGRAKLVGGNGAPLKAASLPADRNFIFHYPFSATPCFLLNLGRPARATRLATADKRGYDWKGGVGPRRSIVAYSAICAHQLAYPTKEISFISYRTETSALGGEMFNQFFAKYEMKLALEGARGRAPAADTSAVIELENYCRQQVKC